MRNIIIIVEGGCMTGVFGGGVLTAFDNVKLQKRVEKIYGVSAGAHNAAYFVSEQLEKGSSIYYENLCENKFINRNNAFKYLRRIITKKKIAIVNIDYLEKIEKTKKKLDIDKIKKSKIIFKILVYNIKEKKWEFIDGKKDTIKAIKASSAVIPFYPKSVIVNKKRYIDGGIIKNKLLEDCIEKDKINIVISNDKRNLCKEILRTPFMILYSILSGFVYGPKFTWKMISSYYTFLNYKDEKNLILIENKTNIKRDCTDKAKLIELYNHGIKEGEKALKKILDL